MLPTANSKEQDGTERNQEQHKGRWQATRSSYWRCNKPKHD